MAINEVQRLEITLKTPNPIFEKWLERWLYAAECRKARSQHVLREALVSLRSYPLPLNSGRECAILRGFGTKLCKLIDKELTQLQLVQPEVTSNSSYQKEVQQVAITVSKAQREKPNHEKQPKLTKKAQKAIAEEEQRVRQVTMSPGSFRVVLLVDTQETNGKSKRVFDQTRRYLDSMDDLQFEVRRLTVGDFLWIAIDADGNELVLPYIVERKRMDDLASSIRDGRFHEQKHRLRNCGLQNVIYLVEDHGDNEHVGLPLATLEQAMANTQIQSGFTVVRTENNWRSIVYLQGMTRALTRIYKNKVLIGINAKEELRKCQPQDSIVGLLKFRSLYEDSARNALLTVREVFVQQLLQLHSLSLERALAIVEVYGTPRLLLDGYKKSVSTDEARLLLADIRCGQLERPIGAKISETIYNFYCTEF